MQLSHLDSEELEMARLRMRLLWLGKVSLVLVTLAMLGTVGYAFLLLFASLASADAAL
jgi:hypothetical protein